MAERFNASVLKTEEGVNLSVGSNPTLPAIKLGARFGFDFTSALWISMQRNDKVGLFKSLSKN